MITAILSFALGYGLAHVPTARLDALWAKLKALFTKKPKTVVTTPVATVEVKADRTV